MIFVAMILGMLFVGHLIETRMSYRHAERQSDEKRKLEVARTALESLKLRPYREVDEIVTQALKDTE